MFSYLNEKALRKSLCPLVILLARGKIEIVSHRVLQNRNNPQWALPSPKFRRRRRTCLQLHRTPVPQASHRDHPVVGRDATIVTRFQGHHHLLWPRNAPDTLLPFARQGPSQLYLWRGTEEAQYPAHAGHLCSGGTSDGGPLAVSPPQNRWCERLVRQSLRWFGRAASARARASRVRRSTSRFARTDRCLPRLPAGSIQR